MATWPEARAAKAERQRRERRFYTPDMRGPRCPVCGQATDKLMVELAGTPVHPTCEPEFKALQAAAR